MFNQVRESDDAESQQTIVSTLSAARLARFEKYVAAFRSFFQRADQFLRFRAYLHGLLETTDRKNIESIAAASARVMMVESNLSQALQHFVSQSPWDARRFFATVRQRTASLRHDPDAVWVVHDGAFAKKGRHSVGVQRQFARSLGKKINCQVGVFVAQIGPMGYFPLTARLYLPAAWLRDHADTAQKFLPPEERNPVSKVEIAMKLLDELVAERAEMRLIVAEEEYRAATEFSNGLEARCLSVHDDPCDSLAEALQRFDCLKETLGLDHFEGRSWQGWHHHIGLVFAAHGFLSSETKTSDSSFRLQAGRPAR